MEQQKGKKKLLSRRNRKAIVFTLLSPVATYIVGAIIIEGIWPNFIRDQQDYELWRRWSYDLFIVPFLINLIIVVIYWAIRFINMSED
ncbi:Uncharacterised protein [Oligella urethralis]|uniref:hypothetical protein n=1 Tax=Oligella urethralis TaxID=90245 RepID=UPI000DFCE333|nr:hypothetical protein [Oligella urethralis]SUA63294.1 Uncharacterised protein [Oligella urethralis]